MRSSSYPYVSHASLWGFTHVHVLNPSFPLRSAHVPTTCQMQKYITCMIFWLKYDRVFQGVLSEPRKWYSIIIIFTQISTVTWCNLYVCTNHRSFGIPAKIYVYIRESNEWAFSKNLLSLPAALLGNVTHWRVFSKDLKGCEVLPLWYLWCFARFWTNTKTVFECFRCFSKNSFSSLPALLFDGWVSQISETTTAFGNFSVAPLNGIPASELRSALAEFFLGLAIDRYWLWRYVCRKRYR